MQKTFYLWDLGDTLFCDVWDVKKSGMTNYDAYVESLGYDLKIIKAHDYEWAYESVFRNKLYIIKPAPGFKEVLTWAKHNGVFTTGNKEQIDWRAEQVRQTRGFDIRDYLGEIYSTFDYGEMNVKTRAMLQDIVQKKFAQGFESVVYTDNKEENCRFFLEAIAGLQKDGLPIKARAYQIFQDDRGVILIQENFAQVGRLVDIKQAERNK